ncbi:MAG: potassium channel family protein [Actinomycetota bacterium]|nr:potassium channel family protein [Actinomycetota bacterium]
MHRLCDFVVYAAWACFAIDYAGRLVLADRRWSFVWHHILDLASIALPILRPLRLLRLVALIRAMNRTASGRLHGRIGIYVGGAAGLIVFVASLAELDAERGRPGANIETFGNALWWAFTTVTTVGYGDRYPVTRDGRLVAVGLMLSGIALIGVVTAAIASWLIARVRAAEEDATAKLSRQIEMLTSELIALRRDLSTK